MGHDYLTYGVQRISDLYLHGSSRAEAAMFPQVTICSFEVRSIGRHRPYTVQCTLPINIFNSKIFLLIWYWVAAVAMLNIIIFVYQATNFTAKHRYSYIKELLQSADMYDSEKDKPLLKRFVYKYLCPDGYLVVRLMAYNANGLVSTILIRQLWNGFKYRHQKASMPSVSSNMSASPSTPIKKRKQIEKEESKSVSSRPQTPKEF